MSVNGCVALMGESVVWLAGPFTNGPYRFFCVLGGLVLAIGLMQMPSWIWWRRVGHGMCGVDGGIGRLVGRAVRERPLRVFWRSGRYGVGHRFDADAKLDLVSSRWSWDVWR